jgi:hypothetical protein
LEKPETGSEVSFELSAEEIAAAAEQLALMNSHLEE